MKKILNLVTVIAIIGLAAFSSCTKSSDSPTPSVPGNSPTCNVTGTTVTLSILINPITGAVASYVTSNGYDEVDYNYLNGFYIHNGVITGYIVDVGLQTCLNFSNTVFNDSEFVAYFQGHGYEGKFTDGTIVKFIAGANNNGIIPVTYIFN